MDKKQRMINALEHIQPDKIPIFENCINPDVTIKMCGIYKIPGLEKMFDYAYKKLSQKFQAGFLGSFQGGNIEKLVRNYSFVPEIVCRFWKDIDAVAIPMLVSKGVYQKGNNLIAVSTGYDAGILKNGTVEASTLFMPENENAKKEDIKKGLQKQAELLINRYNKGEDLKLKAKVFSEVCKKFENKILVIPSITGFYEMWLQLCGNKFRKTYTLLVENVYKGKKEPIDLMEVWDAKEKYLGKLFHLLKRGGVEVVFLTDDLAYANGPMHNPKVFDELIFPRYKNLIEKTHSEGMKIMFHTDGKLNAGENWSLLESIVNAGFDALHPIETPLNNPFEIIKKVGDKITLLCNIPKYPESKLQNFSKEDVEKITIKYFSKLAKEGNVIFCSGNSLSPGCNLQKIQIQHKAVKKIKLKT